MHRLANIEAFVTSAELCNFTLAARRLGLTPSALSRRISQLETQLGVRLFHRSTRVVRLSEEGRAFFERARAALRGLEDAEQALAGQRERPSGSLRVEAPPSSAAMSSCPPSPSSSRVTPTYGSS